MLFVQKITQSEGRMALRMHGLKQPANMNLETEYLCCFFKSRASWASSAFRFAASASSLEESGKGLNF